MTLGRRSTILLAVAFLAGFACLGIIQATRSAATWDEFFHLSAGYAASTRGDYRIGSDHLPLQRIWAALPLMAMKDIRFISDPKPDSDAYLDRKNAIEVTAPYRFLYLDNDTERLLHPARLMNVLLGILLGILVFRWADKMYGSFAALAALLLYCLEPNILAHSSLVTTDFGITCFFFGTAYYLWRLSRKVTWGNAAGLTLFFALAQVSKFTALLLGPIVLVLLLIRTFREEPWPVEVGQARSLNTRRSRSAIPLIMVLLLVAASFTAVWAAYQFHYDSTPVGSIRLEDQGAPASDSAITAIAQWANEHHLLPRAYVEGFLASQQHTSLRISFLCGQLSLTGWWYYFPLAFLVKTPLALLILMAGGLVLFFRHRRPLMQDGMFLFVPIVIYLGFIMTSRYNIGFRHILPITPLAILLAAKCFATPLPPLGRWGALAALLVAGLEAATIHPHPLSFFNALVGGPRNGYRVLVDSNLDWGQDLKELKSWQEQARNRYPGQTMYLSYFGSAPPDYYGIQAELLPGYGNYQLTKQNHIGPLQGGIYCISASMLECVYVPFPGQWCVPYEGLYQDTLAQIRILESTSNDPPEARAKLIKEYGENYWNEQLNRFQHLRFSRLCSALRQREPDDRIGYSIFIYVLTDQEVQAAIFGPPAGLTAAAGIKGQ